MTKEEDFERRVRILAKSEIDDHEILSFAHNPNMWLIFLALVAFSFLITFGLSSGMLRFGYDNYLTADQIGETLGYEKVCFENSEHIDCVVNDCRNCQCSINRTWEECYWVPPEVPDD